jgi:putative methyltransferase (TIGR04325 family)
MQRILTTIFYSPRSKRLIERVERALPPLRKWHRFAYEEHFYKVGTWERLFHGVYPTFDRARQAAPKAFKIGFDNEEAAHFLGHKGSIFPSDYPMLFWLQKLMKENCFVFDFGGYLGISFYSYRKCLEYPRGMQWKVLDVPTVVSAGRKLAAGKCEPGLTFTTDFRDAEACDILIAAGSIQFCDEPLAAHLSALKKKPTHLLINKVPLAEGKGFVTLHNMGPALTPYRIFNREEFVAPIQSLGYELIDDWLNPDLACYIPFHPDKAVKAYSGMYFRRLNGS